MDPQALVFGDVSPRYDTSQLSLVAEVLQSLKLAPQNNDLHEFSNGKRLY